MTRFTETIDTPIGKLRLVGAEDALHALLFDSDQPVDAEPRPGFGGFAEKLRAYFAGDLAAIEAIACDAAGTPFQRQVWALLREIPVGRTASYGELAERLGKPGASRAVGLANGRNPVAVVVPCHRVIGADGKLTGYAGGLERKQWLLAHEGALIG